MPLYRATQKGFYGRMYKPGETFRTDEPLGTVPEGKKKRKLPTWIEEVKEESRQEAERRKALEKAQELKTQEEEAKKAASEAKAQRRGSSDPDFTGGVETL